MMKILIYPCAIRGHKNASHLKKEGTQTETLALDTFGFVRLTLESRSFGAFVLKLAQNSTAAERRVKLTEIWDSETLTQLRWLYPSGVQGHLESYSILA